MLITKKMLIKWQGNTKGHFEEKGYNFTKFGDSFEIDVFDLSDGSKRIIEVACDYCLKEGKETIIKKEWKRYVKDNIKSVVKTDCCASCQPIKTKECNLINYGVESKTELPETQEKIRQSFLKKYGVDHNMKSPKIREKAVQTFIERYGVDNPTKNPQIVEKAMQTRIERYGSTNVYNNKEIYEKTIQTNLEKYGVEWQMQSDEVMKKSKESMHKHGTAPCSRQQKYLHNLLSGELNYPVDRLSLDIAFPDEKVYIEYDGNGHELSVRMGVMSQEEFDTRERKRYYFLRSLGWKKIKIDSPYDYLPNDEIIIYEIDKAKKYFNETKSSFYEIKIGKKIEDESFGRLRRISDEDILNSEGVVS